jgi:hypothetical protein
MVDTSKTVRHANPLSQGSVNPKENPPGAVVVNAPPMPAEEATASPEQKPIMETAEAEQEAGKMAMDMWKRRQSAEEEAGKAAIARHV